MAVSSRVGVKSARADMLPLLPVRLTDVGTVYHISYVYSGSYVCRTHTEKTFNIILYVV